MPQSHGLVAGWNKFSVSAAGSRELCTKPAVAFPASEGFSHSMLCFSTGLGVFNAASKQFSFSSENGEVFLSKDLPSPSFLFVFNHSLLKTSTSI